MQKPKKLKYFVGTGKDIFLKGNIDFTPEEWGTISFNHLNSFINQSKPGDLVAIYVTKYSKYNKGNRGKLVCFYEISHTRAKLQNYISKEKYEQFKKEIDGGKWKDCVRINSAWIIEEEDRGSVEKLLPTTYYSPDAGTAICNSGAKVTDKEKARLLELQVTRSDVHGRNPT